MRRPKSSIRPRLRRGNRRRATLGQRAVEARRALAAGATRAWPFALLAIIAVGLPYAALQAYGWTLSSPTFSLKHVEISGGAHVDRREALKWAEVGLGTNIFSVEEAACAARLERHPWVAEARVTRHLPDRMEIVIVEHQPVALALLEGEFALLNARGEPFKKLLPQDARAPWVEPIPLITGLTRAQLARGPRESGLTEALSLVERWDELEPTLGPLSELHLDSVLGLSVVLARSGLEVRLGRGRLDERLARLRTVHADLNARGARARYILLDQEEDLSRVAVGLLSTKDR